MRVLAGVITSIAVDVGGAVGLDCPQLDRDGMRGIGRVLQSVTVPASTAVLLPAATERTARETEPKVRGEAAVRVRA